MGPMMDLKTQTSFKSFDISAKAIICRGEQVLLLRRPNGRWDLPGGGVRPGEAVADALLREVHEETGLTVGAASQLSIIHRKRSNGRDCLVVPFHCCATFPPCESAIALSGEHEDFGFFGFEQTGHLRLRTHHKRAINDAWHFLQLSAAA